MKTFQLSDLCKRFFFQFFFFLRSLGRTRFFKTRLFRLSPSIWINVCCLRVRKKKLCSATHVTAWIKRLLHSRPLDICMARVSVFYGTLGFWWEALNFSSPYCFTWRFARVDRSLHWVSSPSTPPHGSARTPQSLSGVLMLLPLMPLLPICATVVCVHAHRRQFW